jgi:succinyl-diaminopimelate desuccinylase
MVLFIIALVVALYVFFSIVNVGISPASAAGSVLFILIFAGYFFLKPLFSVFEYSFENDAFFIRQYTANRLVREISIDRQDIKAIKKGRGGKRLYSSKNVLATLFTDSKKYTVSIDNITFNLLNGDKYIDCIVDADFDECIEELKKIVNIPSVKEAPDGDMPFGKPLAEVLDTVLSLCARLGMRTKNVDNYCGWAEIGEGERLIVILCHLDVVPAGDGWDTDPFEPVIKGDEMFGRGTIDNKGPALSAIYALNAIKKSKDIIPCRVRLVFGCDEESDWECMDRYTATEDMPDIAFTPDAEFPVINTEKGIAHYAVSTGLQEGEYQLYLNGGLRANMVPDKACATVIGNIDKLFYKLNDYDVHSKNLSFSVKDDTLTIDAWGVAAHGSTPELGQNAFFELFRFLDFLDLKDSQGEFVKTMLNVFVDKTDGSGAGLNLSDEASGALTMNLGMCFIGKNETFSDMLDDSCRAIVDIRYPISFTLNDISAKFQSALPPTWEIEVVTSQQPHHVDKDSDLVKTLMDVYHQYVDKDAVPLSMGGGTYARAFPNRAVAFGMQFPTEEDKAHKPNESVNLEGLRLSTKIFAAAIDRLIGLE